MMIVLLGQLPYLLNLNSLQLVLEVLYILEVHKYRLNVEQYIHPDNKK